MSSQVARNHQLRVTTLSAAAKVPQDVEDFLNAIPDWALEDAQVKEDQGCVWPKCNATSRQYQLSKSGLRLDVQTRVTGKYFDKNIDGEFANLQLQPNHARKGQKTSKSRSAVLLNKKFHPKDKHGNYDQQAYCDTVKKAFRLSAVAVAKRVGSKAVPDLENYVVDSQGKICTQGEWKERHGF